MTHANRVVVSGTTLILCPELAKHLGKSAALVLQQVHYWLSLQNKNYGIIEDDVQWIRNSYRQWQEQIPHLSLTTIRRTFSFLEEKKIIQSKTIEGNKYYPGGDQVKYFTINYDELEKSVGSLSAIRIHRPGCHIIPENLINNVRAGGVANTKVCSSSPPSKMNTPPVQNEHPPIYITKTTSESFSFTGQSSTVEILTNVLDSQNMQTEREVVEFDKKLENITTETVKDMIHLWNQIIETSTTMISLTPQRSRYLTTAFKQFFNSDLTCWESFCLKIASSKFLMGEVTPFKVHLDWALKFSTLQRILEGAYSFGDRFVTRSHSSVHTQLKTSDVTLINLDAQRELITPELEKYSSEHERKTHVQRNEDLLRATLQNYVGEALYVSWFKQTHIQYNQDLICDTKGEGQGDLESKPYLVVSSPFVKQRIKTHFRDVVELYFNDVILETESQFLQDGNTKSKTSNIASISYDENLITIEQEEKRVQEKIVAPPLQLTLDWPVALFDLKYHEEAQTAAADFESEIGGGINTECGGPVFVSESEPQYDLITTDELKVITSDPFIKVLCCVKPDFPFTNSEFREHSDEIYTNMLKPPDVTLISLFTFQRFHQRKNLDPPDRLTSVDRSMIPHIRRRGLKKCVKLMVAVTRRLFEPLEKTEVSDSSKDVICGAWIQGICTLGAGVLALVAGR
eukprot:gene20851-27027_t